jgi:two-component system chemotaxis response regulator CheY
MDVLGASTAVPDLGSSDRSIPKMTTLEFVTAVHADPKYRTMALMMATTESERTQLICALAAGAHEYVIKPFTPDAIEKLALLGLATNAATA